MIFGIHYIDLILNASVVIFVFSVIDDRRLCTSYFSCSVKCTFCFGDFFCAAMGSSREIPDIFGDDIFDLLL